MPKVSVIIPNYNHAAYLEQRIATVLAQTFQDFELILLDDCSTDGSAELVKQYANHPKVTATVVNAKNSGSPFKQWNRGVALASGRFIWIAESDDFADERLLATLVAAIEQADGIGIAFCHSWNVDETGKVNGDLHAWYQRIDPRHWQASYVNKGTEEIGRYLIHKNALLNVSAVLFRKEVFVAAGQAPEDMYYCGDWLTWVRMLLTADVAYVAQPLNYFRNHGATTRNLSSFPKQIARMGEEYRVARFIETHNPGYPGEVQKRYDQLLKQWLFWGRFYRYAPRHFTAMFRIARQYDAQLAARMGRYVLGRVIRRR
jgi:glycosyltransferase involved in cell wall biosynthesis